MSHRPFPVASPFLEMLDKRRQYSQHVAAMRHPGHVVDDVQPETPSRLITRGNRYIELQRIILKTGEDNIKLMRNANISQKRSRGVGQSGYSTSVAASSTYTVQHKNGTKNWVQEMDDNKNMKSATISRKNSCSVNLFGKPATSERQRKSNESQLPPLEKSGETEAIQFNKRSDNITKITKTNDNKIVSRENIVIDEKSDNKTEDIISDTNAQKQEKTFDNNDHQDSKEEKTLPTEKPNTTFGSAGEKGRLDEMLDSMNNVT